MLRFLMHQFNRLKVVYYESRKRELKIYFVFRFWLHNGHAIFFFRGKMVVFVVKNIWE
jgi:hypothetical protein